MSENQAYDRGIWSAPGTWREALQFNRAGSPDYWLLAIFGAILVLGLVMLYSASFVSAAYEHEGGSMYYLGRQLRWVLLGALGALVAMRVDYRFWRRFSVSGMVVVVLLLLAVVLLPEAIVPEINGAKRWFKIGPFSAQPSQLAYLVFVVYIADWLSKRGQRLRRVAYGLVPFATILGLLAGLMILEPDMGTAVILVLIGAVVFLVAGADLKQFTLAGLLGGGIFLLLARFAPYRWARLMAFINPWDDPTGIGYHLVHNQMALGTGGLFGVGLGQGRQKFYWLPSAYSDSIFAVIGEELGLLGCLLFIALFLWVAYRGYTIALRAPDRYGLLLGVGITSWISFQALLNMMVVAGLLPFTGMTLPFVSYGGSSLASCMTAMGILLNLSCYENTREPSYARPHRRRGDWWTRLSRPGRSGRSPRREPGVVRRH
ncbi:MAG: putative lipid II flippase FtsW [Chloroflexia bacterium]|nr:putative lipid II flippase FtsW [Chloroflexia bacterium]